MIRFLKILGFLAMIACWAGVGWGDPMDDRVREIADQLRCPTCQAQSVKDSDAGLSVNMKHKIRELLAEGRSEEEILQFFVERYGEWILRSPPKQGFALLLWVMPGLVIVVAVWLLLRFMVRRNRQREQPSLTPLSEAERKRIENDLKDL